MEQFKALFNFATIGIIITDHEGKIIHFNNYAASQFGYTTEEVHGKHVELLIPGQFKASHIKLRNFFYHHPEPRRMGEGRDLHGLKKDGTEFPVEVSLSYYYSDDKIYVIAFVIDITVRKKTEDIILKQKEELEKVATEVKELNIELEQKVDARTRLMREALMALEKSKRDLSEALAAEKELNELKSRFVTMASHEFRTPLSTILSSAFLIEKYNNGNFAEQREKHIRRIRTSVAGMKNILEDFLSLGKLEEGLIHTAKILVPPKDLLEIFESIIQDLEQMFKPGQRVEFNHKISYPSCIDKEMFKNILINLISNAIKFSPENSPIEVSCKNNPETLFITVKDHGIGIPEDEQQHLFGRFFRATNAVNIQGTGLGLHIVTKYLELMNGTIGVRSKANAGSTFTVRLPSKIN